MNKEINFKEFAEEAADNFINSLAETNISDNYIYFDEKEYEWKYTKSAEELKIKYYTKVLAIFEELGFKHKE